MLPKTSQRVNSAAGGRGVGDGDALASSGGLCTCRSPSFPVIQDSVLKGKLGIPEARVNRLMNRSVSCTVKNPKVEVFGYPPASTQAGVAPFNILVGASPPWGFDFLSPPFPSQTPGGCSGLGSLVGCWDPCGLGGKPKWDFPPAPCPQHPWVLSGASWDTGCGVLQGFPCCSRIPRRVSACRGSRCAGGWVFGAFGAAQSWGCGGERG